MVPFKESSDWVGDASQSYASLLSKKQYINNFFLKKIVKIFRIMLMANMNYNFFFLNWLYLH